MASVKLKGSLAYYAQLRWKSLTLWNHEQDRTGSLVFRLWSNSVYQNDIKQSPWLDSLKTLTLGLLYDFQGLETFKKKHRLSSRSWYKAYKVQILCEEAVIQARGLRMHRDFQITTVGPWFEGPKEMYNAWFLQAIDNTVPLVAGTWIAGPVPWLLFSRSVLSKSLGLHELQHSPSPGVCSNSCPLTQWCHPTISSSVIPFSSCLLSFLASGSFPMSQLFAAGGQSTGASASVLPMNIQDWFLLGLTGLQSKGLLAVQRTLKSLLQHHSSKASIL